MSEGSVGMGAADASRLTTTVVSTQVLSLGYAFGSVAGRTVGSSPRPTCIMHQGPVLGPTTA